MSVIFEMVIEGDPVTKGRPRHGRGGKTYTPAKTRIAQDAIGFMALNICHTPNETDDLSIDLMFATSTHRRQDIDNFIKLVLDSLNGIVWKDDTQITELHAHKMYDKEHPRTEIRVSLPDKFG